jgi:hypothetical protein
VACSSSTLFSSLLFLLLHPRLRSRKSSPSALELRRLGVGLRLSIWGRRRGGGGPGPPESSRDEAEALDLFLREDAGSRAGAPSAVACSSSMSSSTRPSSPTPAPTCGSRTRSLPRGRAPAEVPR